MKTWVSHTAGGPETLVLEDRPMPAPGTNDVLVRVEAVGINFPDGLLIRDLYQVKPARPLVPGSEFAGTVIQVGSSVTSIEVGDAVIGRCGWGAMCEFMAISEGRCVVIPKSLPRIEAAAFLFAYATAFHALQDAGALREGQKLLVLGAAGGVGSAAVEVGKALGATVCAAASSRAKVDFALAKGADTSIVYRSDLQRPEDQKAFGTELKEIAPEGFDVVFDPVGGGYAEPAVRSLARGGRHLIVGFTAGIPKLPLNLALLKSASIVGVDWRMFVQEHPEANTANVRSLLNLWQKNKIQPQVTEVFPFGRAPDAIARIESREVLGKIVVEV